MPSYLSQNLSGVELICFLTSERFASIEFYFVCGLLAMFVLFGLQRLLKYQLPIENSSVGLCILFLSTYRWRNGK
jgi:hypothetical protein